MPTIEFDEYIDDGRIALPKIPITFPAYRDGRTEPGLHLNDILYRNHAIYHDEHDACPSVEILTSWAFRGLQGMRSYRLIDRYAIERVSPHNIVRRFVSDLDRIHIKLDRTDGLERKRQLRREKAVRRNNQLYHGRLSQTLMLLRQGSTQIQIAEALGLCVRTIKRHVKALRDMGESWDKEAASGGDISISPPHVTSNEDLEKPAEDLVYVRFFGYMTQSDHAKWRREVRERVEGERQEALMKRLTDGSHLKELQTMLERWQHKQRMEVVKIGRRAYFERRGMLTEFWYWDYHRWNRQPTELESEEEKLESIFGRN